MTRSLKVLPTLLRVGFAEAVAYRAEMLIWVLATTMPFVMMVLWTTVARTAPVVGQGGEQWGSDTFIAYFLAVFVVRQLVSAWAAWEITFEIRGGTLAMRLLRPLHPVIWYAMSNIAYMPQRVLVTTPVIGVLIAAYSPHLSHDALIWLVWLLSIAGAWLIAFFVNVTVGSLTFFVDSSLKVMDVYLAAFFVFSGYMFPLDLFPPWLREITDWLPFRFLVSFPVDLMLGKVAMADAWSLLAKQYAWAAGLATTSLLVWRFGVKRFQSFGG